MSSETGCGCFGGCAPSLTLDPSKRVHYAQGLVLGVDEFVQEEYYFLEGARRHHRTLHGYGTVCGLGVSARDASGGLEVRVEPGHAIDTNGRELRVDTAQCALLNDWLAQQTAASPPLATPSPPVLEVWVSLCYRECLTDQEPIPGAPCRTPDEAMTPTRVTESFSLRLDLERPDMSGLDAIRAFARLIRRIEPVPGGTPTLTIAELEAEVAGLAPMGSPPASPPGSPPSAVSPASPPDGPIDVPDDLITDYLNAAFRTWVTVVRPALVPVGRGCADGPGGDGCIALARLAIPVTDTGGSVTVDGAAAAVVVEDADRPLLLSTQLLQELLINGGATGAGGGASDHDQLLGLGDDDHPQYLLITPRTPGSSPTGPDVLVNDLSGGGTLRLRDLPNAAATGDAMPSGQPAGGDLSGTLPDPTVTGLQGLPVPQPGNADQGRHLAVERVGSNLAWRLVDPPSPGGGSSGETELVRLQALSWLHNAPSNLIVNLRTLSGGAREVPGIAVGFGIDRIEDSGVLLGIDRENQRLDRGSLDIHSFRIYAELPDDRFPSARQRFRLDPLNLIPIVPQIEAQGQTVFTDADEIPGTFAPGALLEIDPDAHGRLLELGALVWVEIDGDHILGRRDESEPWRAVDTEFLRSRLPSGDRPEGADQGTQGGLFSSWINRPSREGFASGGFDLNRIDFGVLRALGISATVATRFIRFRTRQGGFANLDDVGNVPNLSARARRLLTNANRFFVGPR